MLVWRRLDLPGHEACRFSGQTLEGTAVLATPPCALTYFVLCDDAWRTRSAHVIGWIESRTVDLLITAENGHWSINGVPQPQVDGCTDVDLNFSPSTNTLPIRRLNLAIGESAVVHAAWLRFPALTLERLDQTYRRTGLRTWQYSSDNFTAAMEVDEQGLVRKYEGGWEVEGG